MIDTNLFDIRQAMAITLEWIIWVIKYSPMYLLIVLLGGLVGLYFEQYNIARPEVCAAKIKAVHGNKRSSYDQH